MPFEVLGSSEIDKDTVAVPEIEPPSAGETIATTGGVASGFWSVTTTVELPNATLSCEYALTVRL